MNKILLLILAFCVVSCKQQKLSDGNKPGTLFSKDFLTGQTPISIGTEFSDCGEWGGHKENILIKEDEKNILSVYYTVYPFNCDSIDYYYHNQNIRPVVNKKVIVTEKGKNAVDQYVRRLFEAKFSETFPGHAGDVFYVYNSDSSLQIVVYDAKQSNRTSFKKLLSELIP